MTDEKKKADPVVTVDYEIRLFPDEKLGTTASAKYSPAFTTKDGRTRLKVTCALPLPTTDEEAKRLYNLSIAQIIEKGVTQITYNERFVTNFLAEKVGKGVTALSKGDLATIKAEVEKAVFVVPRESKAGPKVTAGEKAALGKMKEAGIDMSDPDKVAAMIAAYQAAQAK